MVLNRKCNAIFVDYFDTLVFRRVTPEDVILRWADCLGEKLPSLTTHTVKELPAMRAAAFADLRKSLLGAERTEVTYEEALGEVHRRCEDVLADIDREAFVALSKKIDFALECGCQYANRRLVRHLLHEKTRGRKVYVVSDYYLPAEMLVCMMRTANVPEGLVDDVFVSCDVGKRKAVGDMYPYVLERMGLRPDDVVMIGDSRTSDRDNAARCGLGTIWLPHLAHKCLTHARSVAGGGRPSGMLGAAMREAYRHGISYSEYIAIFYVFTQRLYQALREDGTDEIAFMAREGFYLRRLFEEYQSLRVPEGSSIPTSYYWCSRRSVMAGIPDAVLPEYVGGEMSLRNWLKSLQIPVESAMGYTDLDEDELDHACDLAASGAYRRLMDSPDFKNMVDAIISDNREAFLRYTEPYLSDGVFRFVDSGWKCTTQNAIQRWYGIPTKGYYIGVQRPDEPTVPLERCGLVFSEENPRSRYYDYLGTNIPFYQQLLAAPHGTALKYELGAGGEVSVVSEWDPMEEKLYREHIAVLQEYMLLLFEGLCVWDDAEPWDEGKDWFIAKLSMHSSLFADRNRQRFIRMCTNNYVQNFRQENRGKVRYDPSKAHVGIDVIWRPERYLRYVSKVQRTDLYDHAVVRILYPPIARLYYAYCLLLSCLRRRRRCQGGE